MNLRIPNKMNLNARGWQNGKRNRDKDGIGKWLSDTNENIFFFKEL